MRPKRILIATAILIVFSVLLSGCEMIQKGGQADITGRAPKIPKKTPSIDIEKTVQMAAMAKKEANLVFETEETDGEVKVMIKLKNPGNKPVTSVQSWLSYDPAKFKGENIDASESDFPLIAPYDNIFDNSNGLMMLGRSSATPITNEEINVAVVTFKIMDAEGATINAYDYREDLTGHTSANVMIDGKPYNVLLKPHNPVVVITDQF